MATRKKKEITIKDPRSQMVIGIFLLILSAFIGVGIYNDSQTLLFFREWFGIGVYVIAIALFVLSLRLMGTKNRFSSFEVALYLVLFMLSFLSWINIFDSNQSIDTVQSTKLDFGGKVGLFLSDLFINFLSLEGAFVVLGILSIVFALAALRISPNQVSEFLISVFNFMYDVFLTSIDYSKQIFSYFKSIKITPLKANQPEINIKAADKHSDEINIKDNQEKNEIIQSLGSIKMVSDIASLTKNALSREEKKPDTKGIDNLQINLKANKQSELKSFDNKQTVSVNENPSNNTSISSKDNKEFSFIENPMYQINYPDWKLPPESLLDPIKPSEKDSKAVVQKNAEAIVETLSSFNIKARIEGFVQGPAVTQYFIDPAAGVKFQKISNLSQDLSLTLATKAPLRIEQVPGTSYIGIDVPNSKQEVTQMKRTMKPIFQKETKHKLGMAIGIDISGKPITIDLQKLPHLLIAGATGQGKSVLVNALIMSLIMQKTPDELKFIMIDPKMVEFVGYDGIPHLITSPITDVSKAATALKWAVNEMECRYEILKEAKARNIEQYLEESGKHMPYIVVVVDEYADLMITQRAEVETSIIRIAQKARAVGIHLIIATQRPTADIITGTIKGNIPSRIALKVASQLDSRLILDTGGAETLIGKGDLLFKNPNELRPFRVQGLYMPDSEINRVLNFIKEQTPNLFYDDSILISHSTDGENASGPSDISDDPLFRQAAEIVIAAQKGSASFLQTKMKIGFARAARLIDELEGAGIVGPQDGSKAREVLVSSLESVFGTTQKEE